MLTPKKVKHRKWMKGRSREKGVESRGTEISFGSYGLKSEGTKWVSARQLEASRRAIIRYLRKGGKMWTRVFPDKPVTKKGAEVPMGGGKGGVDHYAVAVKPGRMLFEVDGLAEEAARDALRKAAAKLPLKTKIVKR
ncbi:MAG: 50S ribosomal protein L16 [Candidatus Wildermuthbacteria bacterium RIFCSPLOWO2_01_FULL_48_29]|uniref:Large ribosomal subunit protein uL16 n=2 Tax=Candidatus Wildermuthiibacteriota TaxID=1817923 RepID=A0A1G2RMX6_9BACT|nr:MAG: 50S ribosomal protein L16 [Candidatus Wildermuthbacteria bacterium RIFCSPHIGHO2_01_FULL_48_27b]OHA74176.1 MAG: 50S ribosomal protein L16 [Candidatus Wildermuthbacteria bacterium RIFCSPLOWO2_01_FULL_48_29]